MVIGRKKKEVKAVSIFSDESKSAVSSEIRGFLDDKSVTNRFKTLKAYLDKEEFEYDSADLDALILLVEKQIYEQVFHFSHLMYHYMEQSGDWGEPGEQQVKIAFCRCLLKVDPERILSQDDAMQFLDMVEANIKQLDIQNVSADSARSQMKNYKFKLLGTFYECFRSGEVNRIAQFVGSERHLHGGQYGSQQEYILGEGRKETRDGYDIIFVDNEVLRTPNNVMSMAAIIGHRNIYIRMESLRTIFAQKWVQMFEYTDFEKQQIETDQAWNIAEGIKRRVLKLYEVKTKDELMNIEDVFLKDMSETILFHELGHGIIQHDILPLELGAIGEGTKLYGENIYTAILEFLADFAPKKNDILGPIQNMIQISKTDKARALRMYYMYLSDTWFFNTRDEYMYTYSDLMALILLRYVDAKGAVHFDKLEKDLEFRPDRGKAEKLTLFERIYEMYTWDAEEIKSIIEHAKYTLPSGELDYKKVRKLLIGQFMENDGYVHEDTYEFLVPFWTNMIGYVRQISDSKGKLENYVKNQQRKNLMKMLILSCGRKKAEEYGFDHRKYIMDRMFELKICAKKK